MLRKRERDVESNEVFICMDRASLCLAFFALLRARADCGSEVYQLRSSRQINRLTVPSTGFVILLKSSNSDIDINSLF